MSSDSNNNSDVDIMEQDDINDVERTAIQGELSNLSFEELQKLKERIGAKVYNEAIFGTTSRKTDPTTKTFKRENKNRPREMSSKKPVPMIKNNVKKAQKKELRDPRFDPLCGDFDKKTFASNYKFLSDVRSKDIKAVRAELKETKDPETEAKLRRILQRLTNQNKAVKNRDIDLKKHQLTKEVIEQDLNEGKQHRFKNKSELRVEALVQQYEDLKNEGTSRIQRHLKRRQQKVKKRSFKAPTGS